MSRHRNVRAIDVDEEYDGYYSCYGHSVEEDFCISPRTEAQFLYNRKNCNQPMNAFFEAEERLRGKNSSNEESFSESANEMDSVHSSDIEMQFQCDQGSPVKPMDTLHASPVPSITSTGSPAPSVKDSEENFYSPKLNPSLKSNLSSVNTAIPDAQLDFQCKSQIFSQSGPDSSKDSPTAKLETIQDAKLQTSGLLSGNVSEIDKKVYEGTKINNAKSLKSEKAISELYLKERSQEKPLINLVVIGHVDAGKSTLMGHLLYRLGQVSKRAMHKFEQDSKKLGKSSFMYAWVLDETSEERNRGITMDIAQTKFETKHRSVVHIDAPGHKDFIPNMIVGAAQADVAILVVDTTRGEFETGFEMGGQTREHTMLIRSLGVSQIAVAVNKMDNVNYAEERYKDIVTKMSSFLKQVGFKECDVAFVPCSGLTGENLLNPPETPELRKWYTGSTLIDVIDNFKPPERQVEKPFRLCVADVFKGTSGGFCVAGKIEAGFVKSGDKVLVMPAGEQAVVKAITTDESSLQHGFAGDHVILQLSGTDMNNVASGSMICDIERPVKVTTLFEARLVIFNISTPITKGYPVILHYQSLSEQALIKKLISQLNRSTGEIVKKKPRCLTKNSSAVVEIEVNRPICIELFKDYKELGRIMLRSGGSTIAAGLVTQIK
ncbi:HBS1-like protein isoform X1 [Stegodyphus dumicola]|uniref:HBS1-like protein isoform X1 n=1 Tax=Stegodyphus dumicola TaxID=202533 RepID=UPI0015A7EDBD|nr:HBS1-like protein isoform X1 [Stegodyphus dumicola]